MKQKYLLLTMILFVFSFLFFAPSFALISGDFGSEGGGPPDGCVDFEDLMIFAMAYGTIPSDTNWNPDCDLYLDGKIDFEDLMIFAMHYGDDCGGCTLPSLPTLKIQKRRECAGEFINPKGEIIKIEKQIFDVCLLELGKYAPIIKKGGINKI